MNGNSTYGIVKPSLVNIATDVEIWYHYRPSRSSEDPDFKNFRKIDNVEALLSKSTIEQDDARINNTDLLGMYQLKLPVATFGRKGIYTIYIKPKEYLFVIKDIGALSAYPDIRGIVIDKQDYSQDYQFLFENDNLVGYRVDYFSTNNDDGFKREPYYRIVTSNNKCEPMSQNLTTANSNSNGYRFNDSGTLIFLTVTPSTGPDFKGNIKPYIGTPNQRITVSSTGFDPIMIEVEMVEHDIETLSIMQEGNVVRNLDNGRVSHYNFDNEIYKQYEFFTVKDNYTNKSVAEVKMDKSGNIDNSLDINELNEG